jgi:hypothetical protein
MEHNLAIIIAIVLILFALRKHDPIPHHNSALTGNMYYEETMNTNSVPYFLEVTRMDRETFIKLETLLTTGNRRLTGFDTICTGEKIMIYIQVLKGLPYREIAQTFQHSISTISCIVHEVSAAVMANSATLFVRHAANAPLESRISEDPRYFPFFDNCDGALDGTHISAVLPERLHGPFRNRKKVISQNVLGVCNFDAVFIYALAGWEGSAHDGRVLSDAKLKGLPMRPGKYYLADAGYALSSITLTPYRGTRYHLKEWIRGQNRPANARELFNLRHSALRNVVERIFGIMKKRFQILINMRSYTFPFQIELVYGCMMLHNFIRVNQLYEDEFDQWDDNENEIIDPIDVNVNEINPNENAVHLRNWRDNIANEMWISYQEELGRRNLL